MIQVLWDKGMTRLDILTEAECMALLLLLFIRHCNHAAQKQIHDEFDSWWHKIWFSLFHIDYAS